MEAAVEATNIERMKLVITNYVSSFHFMMVTDKPFNPIIGETFQLKCGKSHYYAEQTSHHPPVTSYYVWNPNFTMWGTHGFKVSMGANSMTGNFTGENRVRFKDGTEYSFSYPDFFTDGIMFGRTYITFTSGMIIEDRVIYKNY